MLTIKTIDNLTKEAIEEAINKYNKPKKNNNILFNDYKLRNVLPTQSYSFVTYPTEIKDYKNRYLFFYFYKEDDNESKDFIKNYGGKLNNILDSIHLFTIYDYDSFKTWGEIKGKEEVEKYLVEFEGDSINNRFTKLIEIGDSYGVNSHRYPALLVYDIKTKKQAIKYFNGYSKNEIYISVKEIINDINENYGNIDLNNIGYISNNENISNVKKEFYELYEEYANNLRGSKSKIASEFGIDYTTLYRRLNYSYNIYSLFTRDEIIMMAIIFNLNKIKSNELLSSYHVSKLDAGDERDQIILKGIECNKSIDEINDTLDNNNLTKLKAEKKKRIFE